MPKHYAAAQMADDRSIVGLIGSTALSACRSWSMSLGYLTVRLLAVQFATGSMMPKTVFESHCGTVPGSALWFPQYDLYRFVWWSDRNCQAISTRLVAH